jgi:hypothetical protein
MFDEISAIGGVTLDSVTSDGRIFCHLVAGSYLQRAVEVEGAIILLFSPNEKENEYKRVGFSALHKARDFGPETTLFTRNYLSRERDQDSLVGWFDDEKRLTITTV